MTDEQFETIVDGQIQKCRQTLLLKAQEYAHGDQLSNFKKAAALENITPEAALWGMCLKHIVSISDFVKDTGNNQKRLLHEWDEKIIDTINYMLLLSAILKEKDNI